MIIQKAAADVLSDVLRLVDARALCSVSLVAGGDWAIHFPMPDCLKFNAVRSGSCWLRGAGLPGPRELKAGDCFVVRGDFVLGSSPDVKPVPAEQVFLGPGMPTHYGEGSDVELFGGSVRFDPASGALLMEALPPILVVEGGPTPIGWLLEELGREWISGAVGANVACNDLLRLMFVHAVRAYVSRSPEIDGSWIGGLSDRFIARALQAIHAAPGRDWSLASLAEVAGQSRSTFAARFRARVGVPPMEYVQRWRMQVAAAGLRNGVEPISAIAGSLGYESDSAFGAAFRRVVGTSPAQYRARRR